ncbi:MAG: M23 family metallopeptidase [Nitrospirae bacterium]|nr:M23 family metallopeptidase [Nitrospirota bacterium]
MITLARTCVLSLLAAALAFTDSEPYPYPYPFKSPLDLGRCVSPGEILALAPAGFEVLDVGVEGGWVSTERGRDGRRRALVGFDMEAPEGPRPYRLSYAIHGRPHTFSGEVTVCHAVRSWEGFGRRRGNRDPRVIERVRREKAQMNRIFWTVRPGFQWSVPFASPVEGELKVTSRFAARRFAGGDALMPHTGVDLRARSGTPINAVSEGTVALVDRFLLEGNVVILDHGGGLHSLYAHLSRVDVKEGQAVTRGQALGLAGRTGHARGAHLHMGVRLMGARIDPMSLLRLGGLEAAEDSGPAAEGMFADLHLYRRRL